MTSHTPENKTHRNPIRATLLRGAVPVFGLLLLTACGSASGASDRINVFEPGDSTKSCAELKSGIASMDETIGTLQSAVNSKASRNTWMSGLTNYSVNNAYAGYKGSLFGPLQSMFAKIGDASRERDIQGDQQQLNAAQQRRLMLTNMYNQRCF